MLKIKNIFSELKLGEKCRELGVDLWSCPRFIFVIMGAVIITAIIATYIVGQHYVSPDAIILLVSLLTVFLLVVGQTIVSAFERVVVGRNREITHVKEIIELRDQFVYIAIHDLASAATAMKWGMRTLEPKIYSHLPPTEKELFAHLRLRNERLIGLSRQILNITKLESANIILRNETIDPIAFISGELASAGRNFTSKGVSVTYNPPSECPLIEIDPKYFTDLLRTLLNEASDHAAKPTGAVHIFLSHTNDTISITIENDGPALDPLAQQHIFEKLWRDENGSRIEGLGFGYYIAKKITDLFHGKISFTSIPDHTVFVVTLPLHPIQ